MRSASIAIAASFATQTLLGGCTVVPALSDVTGASDNTIFVNDVVARVKCEVTIAFADKMESYPWLDDWTVKADLSLQADEQGGISPSGSYTTYTRSAVNTAAGPANTTSTALGLVPQFFTFTASANVGAQAVVTDGQSFTLSLMELRAFRLTPQFAETCALPQSAGLTGNLRLREWVNTSLGSVDARILLAGDHKAPNSAGAPKPQIVPKPTSIPGTSTAHGDVNPGPASDEDKQQMKNELNRARHAAEDTGSNLVLVDDVRRQLEGSYKKATQNAQNYLPISPAATQKKLNRQIPLFLKLLAEARKAESCALRQFCGEGAGDCSEYEGGKKVVTIVDFDKAFDGCASSKAKCDEPALPDEPDPNNKTGDRKTSEISGAKQERACAENVGREAAAKVNNKLEYEKSLALVKNEADAAANNDTNSKDLVNYAQALTKQNVYTPDPPIDSISYSAQFVIAIGAGIAPSWTLLAWKGPGLTAPAASASGTRTHILQLALASPSAPTNSGAEQTRVLMNQLLLPH
jgi:hypothetical protein